MSISRLPIIGVEEHTRVEHIRHPWTGRAMVRQIDTRRVLVQRGVHMVYVQLLFRRHHFAPFIGWTRLNP